MLVPSSTLAGAVDRAGGGQDLVDQRGLAGRAVSTEDDVANVSTGYLAMKVSFESVLIAYESV